MLNEFFIELVNFNVINTEEWVDPNLHYLPESDPFSPSFELVGYEASLFIENSSVTIWLFKF